MVKKLLIATCFLYASTLYSYSQNFIGSGNNSGVTISSSDEFHSQNWNEAALGANTLNGAGLSGQAMEASRFLSQSTLGFGKEHIDEVLALGIEGWIDDQLTLPESDYFNSTWSIYNAIQDSIIASGETIDEFDFRPSANDLNYAFWQVNTLNEDLLRQRVVAALSEIFVISKNSDLFENGDGLAAYLDMLGSHAFGNYRDLLRDVTLHPCMGYYLSHLNNPKADPANNIHPDENYAREVMQLFSIGLYELFQNGTRKTNAQGNFIPTYGQDDIREFAKIFTGLGVSGIIPSPSYPNLYFGRGMYGSNLQLPMMMYENEHQTGSKTLLNGSIVPAGQTGMQDIESAIDNLFNHPNVGPFIGYRLIQRLVKSNPSNNYVYRVSQVFNNNGFGVRGDMGAVVKAILMDPEARDCSYLELQSSSRLREPLMRYMHFTRAVDKTNGNDFYWNVNQKFYSNTKHDILRSPSVFNFYLPDHAPVGDIDNANLVAPEFNLHNSRTSVGYLNEVDSWAIPWGNLMSTYEGDFMNETTVEFDRNYYNSLAAEPELLLNELDLIFTHGTLSEKNRSIILHAMEQLNISNIENFLSFRVFLATYLIMISPDYNVMR